MSIFGRHIEKIDLKSDGERSRTSCIQITCDCLAIRIDEKNWSIFSKKKCEFFLTLKKNYHFSLNQKNEKKKP